MEFEEEYAIKPRKWLLIILIIIAIGISIFLVSSAIINMKEKAKTIADKEAKEELKRELEIYSGEQRGIFATKILDKVSTNNQTNPKHKITVEFDSTKTDKPEEITALKKEFDDSSKYSVSLYYDNDGYVNKVTIKLTEKDTSKAHFFNLMYESRTGTQWGISLRNILDEVITNNKTNSEHLLTVKYKNTETTDPEEIKNLKKSFDEWTNYEVSLDYDEDGFVNKIIIE